MTKAELTAHKLYGLLDDTQRNFIDSYFTYRSSRLAAQFALGLKSDDKRRITDGTRELLTTPLLAKLVDMINEEYSPSRAEVEAEFWKLATKPKAADSARVAALENLAEMKGYVAKGKPTANADLASLMAKIDETHRPQ